MARTQGGQPSIHTQSPSGEQSKKRKMRASTSRNESQPKNDTVRFTSKENQLWYEARKDKQVIEEKNVVEELEACFHTAKQ